MARKFKHFINFNPLKYIFLACKFKYLSKFSRIFDDFSPIFFLGYFFPKFFDDFPSRIFHNFSPDFYGFFPLVFFQANDTYFNRGLLFNIGYDIASNFTNQFWECYIFHDVDLLPEDDRNLYTCPYQPRHMSVAINTFNYKLPYKDLFGGVSAMTTKQFIEVNGFSNRFWGWGGEDDDLRRRIKAKGLELTRYSPEIARYVMIKHQKAKPNPKRSKILKENPKMYSKDGLNSLQYSIKKITKYQTHTFISVSVKQKL